jgi:hypothetical protein
VGGPEIHAGYIRRLFKAETAGKIRFGRIVVVDRDSSCPAAALVGDRVRLDVTDWGEGLARHLSACDASDHLVPYHWAPHVLLDWLAHDLSAHGLSLQRDAEPGEPPSKPPVLRATAAGDVAMSYAEWLCPPACIEPQLCPHTRGPKWWSLAGDLATAERSFVFPCMHLAYGVGTIPVSTIFALRDRIIDVVRRGGIGPEASAWVGSASHCHGLAAKVKLKLL